MQKPIIIGNTRLDQIEQCVYVNDKEVNLSPQEYLILEYMLTRRKRFWRQDDLKRYLSESVYYGAYPIPQSRSWLYVQVHNIRGKIKKVGSNMTIEGNANRGGYDIYAA